jgi:hypothetical protein
MSVYKKLQAARVELQSMKMKKSGNNKFAGYNYFELGDFLPTINAMFDKCGLFSQVSYTADLATLRIVDTEDGSDVVFTSPMGSAALKGCHEVQNIGAVETYQRRYLYVTALEIVEHDALDAVVGDPKQKASTNLKQVGESCITTKQVAEVRQALELVGVDEGLLLRKAQIESVETMPAVKFSQSMNWINRHADKGAA